MNLSFLLPKVRRDFAKAEDCWRKMRASGIFGTTKDTNFHEKGKGDLTTDSTDGHGWGGAGPCLDKPSGAAFSNPSTSELARDSENTSPSRFASGPAWRDAPEDRRLKIEKWGCHLHATSYSLLATAPEA